MMDCGVGSDVVALSLPRFTSRLLRVQEEGGGEWDEKGRREGRGERRGEGNWFLHFHLTHPLNRPS